MCSVHDLIVRIMRISFRILKYVLGYTRKENWRTLNLKIRCLAMSRRLTMENRNLELYVASAQSSDNFMLNSVIHRLNQLNAK